MPKCKKCGDDFWIGGTDYCADCEKHAASDALKGRIASMILTTTINVPGRDMEGVVSIVAAESAVGLNIFKDIANNWRDFFGGKSETSQTALKDVRTDCLDKLKLEAAKVGADAVIGIDFDYNQLNTSGPGGILYVVATGTAVKLKPSHPL
ncbi:YbjQ family protein [Agrobacterium rosae]|uniref:UPF0145 protein RMS29_10200 n=1 Tax=Agrobacterium rosae TaxID=1972867 RepID=A0ABU4VVT0_9HYPH|nr:YbjQ family protein [Agrobacterium rosae]MDX8329598.1 YbjQ family protein [Agrobacterium rosae]